MCNKVKLENIDIIVWGTGIVFNRYKKYLSQFNIVKLCDSNMARQGMHIDGIEVISPDKMEDYEYSYIVIMTYAAAEIYQKLMDMNISSKKIILYNQLFDYLNQPILVHSGDREIPYDDWKKKNSETILLLSHSFDYTGAPIALKNMALVLKDMGYSVLIMAISSGNLTRELRALNIDYIENMDLYYNTQDFKKMISQFSVIVVGTFALYRIVMTWEAIKAPILWWIHETYEGIYVGKETLPLNESIRYFAGGNRVKRIFKEHYPDKNIEKLQYCLPDTTQTQKEHHNNRITVAAIGTIEKRKAQDVLLEAINMLSDYYKDAIKLVVIGRVWGKDADFMDLIEKEMCKIEQLEWIEELSQEELDSYYGNIDVLICASRDDPMPIVVTQAMMHEKVCIVSDEVGQAEFIVQKENGLVVKSEDRKELKDALIWVVDNRDMLETIGRKAREIYNKEFSEQIMKEKLSIIFQEIWDQHT